ncbi:MAG: hypothetical protein QOJ56_1048 [Mycobacterium sp.]|nr:hypothetical protein [Mycobacterium sp.]MDT5352516.1 hypothetical protein [Mycobacterium sp.]
MLTRLRQVLSHPVSVGGLTEVAVWLAVGYLTIGLVWSFFHPDGVQRIETQLEQQLQLSAGSNYQLAALAEASVLWPVISVLPSLGCAH